MVFEHVFYQNNSLVIIMYICHNIDSIGKGIYSMWTGDTDKWIIINLKYSIKSKPFKSGLLNNIRDDSDCDNCTQK